ncbi:hypothetical protein D9M70_390620 [compost metagenome]
MHRLLLEREVERNHHDDAWGRVDEEDRLPAVVLGEVAADRRADRRREGDGQGEECQSERLLRLGQPGQDHRESHGDEHAARNALQTAQHDHRAEVMGEGASRGKDREQDRICQDIAPEREDAAEVVGKGDHHDLADQVGGRYPGAIVDAGADPALDVEQRGVGDLDVQDRHEGTDQAGEHRDPCRRARFFRWRGSGWQRAGRNRFSNDGHNTLLPCGEMGA